MQLDLQGVSTPRLSTSRFSRYVVIIMHVQRLRDGKAGAMAAVLASVFPGNRGTAIVTKYLSVLRGPGPESNKSTVKRNQFTEKSD